MKTERRIVLLVSVGTTFGGAETYHLKLAKILLGEYRLVAVVCNSRLRDELRSLDIEVEYAGDDLSGARRYIAALRACRKIIRRFNPHLAHLNGQPESYLALFLRLMGLRLLTTRHTPFTSLFMKEGSTVPVFLKRWFILFSLRCSQRTICVSRLLYSQLAVHLPLNRLSYIPTWVEDPMLESNDRPLSSSPLRVLFVGRVVENKGIFEVIEAVRRCDRVHLTIVGEGDQLAQARERAAGLPIDFAGFMSDCRTAYRAADLLIFPSREGFEGLPQVPLEAMAMRLPCLASDIVSVLELAQRDSSSPDQAPALALYHQGDPEDLASQLNSLATNHAELARLSIAGRQQVESSFTVAAVAPAYLRVFSEAQQ